MAPDDPMAVCMTEVPMYWALQKLLNGAPVQFLSQLSRPLLYGVTQ